MPHTEPLTDDQILETIAAWRDNGKSQRATAKAMGLGRHAVSHRLRRAKERGLLDDPAIQQAKAAVGTKLTPTLAWAKTKNPDGTSYSVLMRPEPLPVEDMVDRIRNALEDLPAAPSIVQSERGKAGKIAFFPHQDVHMGVDVTEDYAGQDYNPDEAYRRMTEGFAEIHATIAPCETAIILNNGDLTHANDNRDVTYKNQHRLKVKGSHRDNVSLCVTATCWQIEMALTRHDRVMYRANAGNHDPNTADYMALVLAQRYRDNPRVKIVDSQRGLWHFQQGQLFLAAHHGHDIKPQKVAADLPTLLPSEFGRSRHWFFFTGHRHHEHKAIVNNIVWWQLPSVCSLDQHAADLQYKDTSTLRAMMFCERGGLKADNMKCL